MLLEFTLWWSLERLVTKRPSEPFDELPIRLRFTTVAARWRGSSDWDGNHFELRAVRPFDRCRQFNGSMSICRQNADHDESPLRSCSCREELYRNLYLGLEVDGKPFQIGRPEAACRFQASSKIALISPPNFSAIC